MKKIVKESLFEFINESKQERDFYGCIMMDSTNISDWKKHTSIIKKEDIYIDPNDDSYGIEDNPHITILYGIHEDETDIKEIVEDIKKTIKQITVTIDNISIFENEKFDVVKYDVPVTKELKKYREYFINKYPNTQTYKDYHPHMTIAYVKPGTGKKYIQKLKESFEITFDKGIYSYHKNSKDNFLKKERKEIKLKK